MPSDLPPNQPQPSGTAGAEGIVGGEARAARGERAGASPADVRRYAATGGGEKRKSSVSNSFALAMIVAFLVVAIIMLQHGPSLVQTPRVLPPLPAGMATNLGAGAPAVAPATATATTGPLVEPNSALARAYGMSALNSASRQARRIGLAVAVAAECGVRTAYWGNEVREGVAKEQAERYPAFEDSARTKEMLRRFIAQEFIIGQKSVGGLFAERGRQAACDDIRYSPDYRAAVNAADQAGIR